MDSVIPALAIHRMSECGRSFLEGLEAFSVYGFLTSTVWEYAAERHFMVNGRKPVNDPLCRYWCLLLMINDY